MAGFVKAKKYDWKDSNLSLFGSDLERKVKKGAAETEKAWKGAGQKVGNQIWRIVNFKVQHWPAEDYGSFYEGDSYIILNTYKPDPKSEELAYDLHFWIGKYSTQDEYGTAAYKTVELDTFLDDKPIQHREVQGHESASFKSYFKKMVLMKGGAASGFRHVEPTKYQPRLLHFKGNKKPIVIKEVIFNRNKLNSDDVFIVDMGMKAYMWIGSGATKDETFRATQFAQELKSERNGRITVDTTREDDTEVDHPLYIALAEHAVEDTDDDADEADVAGSKTVFQLSDASGEMKMNKVSSIRSSLDTNDVFILDDGLECIVWVGKKASKDERSKGLMYAHKYLQSTKHPLVPVSIVREGQGHHSIDKFFQ